MYVLMGRVCLLFRIWAMRLVLLLLRVCMDGTNICIRGLLIGTWMGCVLLLLLGVRWNKVPDATTA